MPKDKRWELFECKRCGVCCTGINVPYDPNSIFEIAEYLNLTFKKGVKKNHTKHNKNS